MLSVGALIWYAESEESAKQEAAAQRLAAAKQADDRRKGFHCLSKWDGSNDSLVMAVKAGLRDPDSFKHIETRITPVKQGQHLAQMDFRARNGFGGMNAGTAIATISSDSCQAKVMAVE